MKRKDQHILECIKAGKDNRAIDLIYESEFDKIVLMVNRNGGNEEEAKDIFQDTVLIFYRQLKLNKYKAESEIGGFIYTIAKNLWINKLKKERRLTDIEKVSYELSDEDETLEQVITEERELKVKNLFTYLGDTCKKLLILSYYNQLSMLEIANIMGFKSETVAKSKKYKCKKFLIEKIKDNAELRNDLKVQQA